MFIEGHKVCTLPKEVALDVAKRYNIKNYVPEEHAVVRCTHILYEIDTPQSVFLLKEEVVSVSVAPNDNEYILVYHERFSETKQDMLISTATYKKLIKWLNDSQDEEFLEFTLRNLANSKVKIKKSQIYAYYKQEESTFNETPESFTVICTNSSNFGVKEQFEEVDKIITGIKTQETKK